MDETGHWIIRVPEEAGRVGRVSWKAYRHRAGQKAVARFRTLGALKRFVKRHLIFIDVRAENEVTHEVLEINGL